MGWCASRWVLRTARSDFGFRAGAGHGLAFAEPDQGLAWTWPHGASDAEHRAGRIANNRIKMRPQAAEGSNRMAASGDQKVGLAANHFMMDASPAARRSQYAARPRRACLLIPAAGTGKLLRAARCVRPDRCRKSGRGGNHVHDPQLRAIGRGDGGSRTQHSFGFLAIIQGAHDGLVGNPDGMLRQFGAHTGPHRGADVVQNFGGDGSEQESADRSMAAGSQHDEVRSLLLGDFVDHAAGLAQLRNRIEGSRRSSGRRTAATDPLRWLAPWLQNRDR